MQTYLKTKPVWVQLLLFLGMAFGILMILSFIGVLLLSNITGISILQVQNIDQWDPNNPKMIFFIRGMLLIQFLGLFLIPSLLFAYFSDSKPLNYLGLKPPQKNIYWLLAIVAMFVAIPAVEYLGTLNQQMNFGSEIQKWMKSMEEEAAKQIQFMLVRHTVKELIINLIFISLFAALGEEIFFRGILQRLFIRVFQNPWIGIFLTAAVFSAFHLQFFGFFPRFVLGIILGAIYWYSGSLWVSIIAHFFYDGFIIVLAYFIPSMINNSEKPIIDSSNLALIGVCSAAAAVAIIWLMKKKSSVSYAEVYRDDKLSELDKFSF